MPELTRIQNLARYATTCSLTIVVTVQWPLLKAVTLAAGNVLAIAALSLVAHNLYLGVLIFQQPDSTFRKAFALGSNVFATTATICLGYHDNLKRCRRAIAYDVQRASAQHAPEQNTYLFLFNMCIGCPNVGAESLINPDAQSLWYWFSDGHALLQGILCILVCDLVAVWLFKSEKVLDLVGAVRDNYVYVTLFFLLRQVVFLFYRDPEEVLPP